MRPLDTSALADDLIDQTVLLGLLGAHEVVAIGIAGNLVDMFAALVPANDLEFRHAVNAPTLRIDGMTVASG